MIINSLLAALTALATVGALTATTAPSAAAATPVTPFTDVARTSNGCTSVRIDHIDPSAGVTYSQVLGPGDLDFPVTLPYDSTGSVTLRARAAEGYTLNGSGDYTLRAPAECFPAASFDIEPQAGTAPTWCSADPDSAITLFVNGDPIDDDQQLSWRLVPQSTDPDAVAVASGQLPAGLFLGEATISRPYGVALGSYDLEFQAPGGDGFPVASVPVLVADCVRLSLSCGVATFANPDTNSDASVQVLPAGGGSSEARSVTVRSGETGSIDVSDLTDGFGWIATGDAGEIGRQALAGPSADCALTGTRPEISGQPVLGRLLTADPGEWQPAPVRLSYRWYRDGRRIPGADGPTHRVNLGDLGHRVRVKVTGHKDDYPDKSLTSAATDPAGLGFSFPWVPRRR